MSNLRNPFAEDGQFDEKLQAAFEQNLLAALLEDVGTGDLTGKLVPEAPRAKRARDRARAGRAVRRAVVRRRHAGRRPGHRDRLEVCRRRRDGADSVVCTIEGSPRSLLTAERSALNFLQLLSGVASATRTYVDVVAGTKAQILDTRKTLPGLRQAQKYAVRVGGGANQRMALYDGILIKENHIAAAGGVTPALRAANALDAGVTIQVEVESIAELEEALAAGAVSVLLDNFDLDMMREAVRINDGRALAGGVGRHQYADRARDCRDRRRPDLDRQPDQGRQGDRLFVLRDRRLTGFA
jgi:nicotinate-nucleotide pyrophosphorylase (carboxylating)